MPYIHSDPSRESQPHALPNVEIFFLSYEEAGHMNKLEDPDFESGMRARYSEGWYWVYGSPGCLWDGEPEGPFETEADAIADIRGEG